jgi:hypothetical protein
MFIIISSIIMALLFGSTVFLYLANRKADVMLSAQDKLIDIQADELGQLIDYNDELIETNNVVAGDRDSWHQIAREWRKRAFAERRLLYSERRATETSINLLSDELDRVLVEHAKVVLNATTFTVQEDEDLQANTMITPGGAPHDRDEWCDRFNCKPLESAPFVNDTYEDVEVPISFYIVDRGE